MGWQTDYTKSGFDAGQKVSDIRAGRQRENNVENPLQALDAVSSRPMSGFGQSTHVERDGLDYAAEALTFGFANTGTEVTTGYDIVGINGNQIGQMRDSITEYVNNVQTYLKNAVEATEDEIANAIRGGEAEKAVRDYLEKVKAYVHNLVSTLLAFNDKLADVGNAWVQAQSNIGQTINSATGSFSEGSAYTDNNVTYSGPSR